MASVYSAGSASVQIVPDFSGAQRKIGQWFASQGDMKVSVTPNLKQTSMARVRAQVAATRPTMHVDIDKKTFATDLVKAVDFVTGTSMVGNALHKLFDIKPILMTNLGGAGTAIAGVVGQATTGLAALLPSFVTAAALPISTLLVGSQGIVDAFSALASGDVEKVTEAMKNLSPAARDFVTEVHSLAGAWKDVRFDVQDKLFAGLGEKFRMLGEKAMPVLQKGLGGLAEEFNLLGSSVIDLLSADNNLADFAHVFDNIRQVMHEVALAAKPILQAFFDLATVGSDFLPGLASGFGGLAQEFADFIRTARDSGALAKFLSGAMASLGDLLRIVGNLAKGIGSIFKAGMQSGQDLIGIVKALTGDLAAFLATTEAQAGLGQFFRGIADAAMALAPALLDIAKALVTSVLPAMSGFTSVVAPVVAGVLTQFADLLRDLAPLLYPALAGAISSALAALAPLIGVFGEVATTILPPVIEAIQRLAPLLSKLADGIGEALVKAVKNLKPLLPGIVDALVAIAEALVPMVVNIFDLGANILPPLVAILRALFNTLEFLAPILPVVLAGFLAFKAVTIVGGLLGTLSTHLLNAAVAVERAGAATGVASLGRLSNGLLNMGGAAESAGSRIKTFGAIFRSAAVGPAAALAAVGIGALTFAISKQSEAIETLGDKAAQWRLQVDYGGESGVKAARKLAGLSAEVKENREAMENAKQGLFGFDAGVNTTAESVGALGLKMDVAKKALEESEGKADALRAAMGPLGLAQAQAALATDDFNTAMASGDPDRIAVAMAHLKDANANLAVETDKANVAAKTQLQLMQEARDKILEAASAQLANENAQARATEGIAAYKESLKDTTLGVEEHEQKERDLRGTLLEAAAASGRVAEQNAASLGPTAAAAAGTQAQIDALRGFAEKVDGPVKDALLGLASDLETNASVAAVTTKKFEDLGVTIEGVPNEKYVEVKAPTDKQVKDLQDLGYHVEHLPNGNILVTADPNPAKAQILAVTTARYTAYIDLAVTPASRGVAAANAKAAIERAERAANGAIGGIVKAYAQGGIELTPMAGNIAQIVKPNTWRVIGDRVRDDEAYIPLNDAPRSQAILAVAAEAMGFTLVANADGNYWMPPGMASALSGLSRAGTVVASERDALRRSQVRRSPQVPASVAGFVNNGTVVTTDLDELSRKSRLGTRRALAVAGL